MMQELNTDMPRLLLIDGLNIVRRCYEANPAPDSANKAKDAARSAFGSFKRALRENTPTHALAAFDYGGPTWRHALYARYREGRKPMPEELRAELPAFKARLTDELGLAVACVPNVEADDVIGTVFTRWMACKAAPAVVVSTDKDLCTLIAQGALVRDHFKPEWRDAAWVQAKFGVGPELLGDLLALMGDSVDDIPGVDGVGAKTAAKLLNEYGSLEALLAGASSIKGKLGERLVEQAGNARLSRQLVALDTAVEVGVTWNGLRYLAPEEAPA
jgi:DNA polymerase-1